MGVHHVPCTCSRVLALACQRSVCRQVKARVRARGSRGANWYSEKRAAYVRSKTRTQNSWCPDMNSKRCFSRSHAVLASPPRSSALTVSCFTAKWELGLTHLEALAPGGGPSRLLRDQAGASIGFLLKGAGKAGWGMRFLFVGFGIGAPLLICTVGVARLGRCCTSPTLCGSCSARTSQWTSGRQYETQTPPHG